MKEPIDPQDYIGQIKHTDGGWPYVEFQDRYDKRCTLQKSSLAAEDAIWLGIHDIEPIVLARDAASVGVQTSETVGWVPYPIPREVQLHSRMHLTREQVAALIPVLQRFVDDGEVIV